MERDVAAGRREIAVIVPAAVALAGFIAFIAACLCQLIRFLNIPLSKYIKTGDVRHYDR